MARKTTKNVSLDREVVDELEDEPNMSGLINDLLRDHYDL